MSDNRQSQAFRKGALILATLVVGTMCATAPTHAQIGFPGEEESSATNKELDLSLEATIARGKTVYDNTCAFCHRADGMGVPEAFPPLVTGAKFDAEPNIIDPLQKLGLHHDGKITLGAVDTQIDVVLHGIPGTRMFAFDSQISAQQVADVVTYIRNAWSNNSGDLVTREQVETIANKKK
ncbi:MAG TPA: c-type cytochrome [Pirellulaceae bacterium]|nr:c-type cytochrome [Hyphomicrobiaceae bacterium]MCC0011091.1 c-type cytochrome [Hyphomicrobiaceae bacterium]HRX78954.1 c-type cytochrome [Pirellulaceae bacterium]